MAGLSSLIEVASIAQFPRGPPGDVVVACFEYVKTRYFKAHIPVVGSRTIDPRLHRPPSFFNHAIQLKPLLSTPWTQACQQTGVGHVVRVTLAVQ